MRIADYLARLDLDTGKAEGKMRSFDRKAKSSGSRSAKLLESNRTELQRLIAVAAPATIVGGFAALIKNASDLQVGLVGVQKTTGLTNAEINSLKLNILDLGTKIPVSAKELLEIAKVAGQLGISGVKDIQKFTETFAKLEIASDRTIAGELGAQSFARFLSNSGEAIENADKVASAFTQLGNESKLTEGQLLATALEVSKVAKTFNLSATDVLGLSTAFTELSIQPEVARTTVTRFFRAVEVALTDGKGLKQLSKVTGLATEELRQFSKEKPEQIFIRFAKGIASARDAGQNINKELKALGLGGVISATALSALSTNTELLEVKLRAASDAYIENNALNKEAAVAGSTLAAETKKLGGAFVEFGDSLASSGAISFLTSLVQRAKESVQILTRLRRENEGFFATTADIRAVERGDAPAFEAGTRGQQKLDNRGINRANLIAGRNNFLAGLFGDDTESEVNRILDRRDQILKNPAFLNRGIELNIFTDEQLDRIRAFRKEEFEARQVNTTTPSTTNNQQDININNDIKVEAANPTQAGNEISRITQADISLAQGS